MLPACLLRARWMRTACSRRSGAWLTLLARRRRLVTFDELGCLLLSRVLADEWWSILEFSDGTRELCQSSCSGGPVAVVLVVVDKTNEEYVVAAGDLALRIPKLAPDRPARSDRPPTRHLQHAHATVRHLSGSLRRHSQALRQVRPAPGRTPWQLGAVRHADPQEGRPIIAKGGGGVCRRGAGRGRARRRPR